MMVVVARWQVIDPLLVVAPPLAAIVAVAPLVSMGLTGAEARCSPS
jgi:hypothetical protein